MYVVLIDVYCGGIKIANMLSNKTKKISLYLQFVHKHV